MIYSIKSHLDWNTEIVPKPANNARWVLIDDKPVQLFKPKTNVQVHRHCWKVERTFGWFIRFRRLARDYEGSPERCEAFIQAASIRLFLTGVETYIWLEEG